MSEWLGNHKLLGVNHPSNHTTINNNELNKYFTLSEIEGITKQWLNFITRELKQYLDFVQWKIDEDKSQMYYKNFKDKLLGSSYRQRYIRFVDIILIYRLIGEKT